MKERYFACAALALLLAYAAPSPAQGLEPAFSYTHLGVSFVRLDLDEPVGLPVGFDGVEQHSTLGGATIGGAYQFAAVPFFLGASGSYLESDGDTQVEFSQGALTAGFAIPAGSAVDVVASASFLSQELDLCADSVCVGEEQDEVGLGLGVRAWAVADLLEVNGQLSHVDGDTTPGVGAALWFGDSHSATFAAAFGEGGDTLQVGYRYTWVR